MCLKIFVVVIPKEGLAVGVLPILFLWYDTDQQYFICDGSRVQFYSRCHTQRRFGWVRPPILLWVWQWQRYYFPWYSSINIILPYLKSHCTNSHLDLLIRINETKYYLRLNKIAFLLCNTMKELVTLVRSAKIWQGTTINDMEEGLEKIERKHLKALLWGKKSFRIFSLYPPRSLMVDHLGMTSSDWYFFQGGLKRA